LQAAIFATNPAGVATETLVSATDSMPDATKNVSLATGTAPACGDEEEISTSSHGQLPGPEAT